MTTVSTSAATMPPQQPCRLIFKLELSTGQFLRRHARILANPD
jgi:hypothetical protein